MVSFVSLEHKEGGRYLGSVVSRWLDSSEASRAGHRVASHGPESLRLRYDWAKLSPAQEVIDRIVREPRIKSIAPFVIKSSIRFVISKLLSKWGGQPELYLAVKQLHEIDKFCSSGASSWKALAEYGRKVVGGWSDPSIHLERFGYILMYAKTISVELGAAAGPSKPDFCPLCWRFKMTSNKYCSLHSPRRGAAGASGSAYRAAQRQLPLFNKILRKLVRADKRYCLRSGWRIAVEKGRVLAWVSTYRPFVYEYIRSRVSALDETDEDELDALIRVLEFVPGESTGERELRARFNKILKVDLAAIFLMILRSESWIVAAEQQKSAWGGARSGAGRPQSSLLKSN